MASRTNNSAGSQWHRWDPHIHTPGTALNDQFKGCSLDEFCDLITSRTPTIRALGVTDYFGIRTYEALCERKAKGRLPDVDLLFPNVELRLGVWTAQKSPLNAHLLFSPEDPNHVDEIKRFLARLTFEFKGERFACSDADLIRLGRAHSGKDQEEQAAYSSGVNQFKVLLKDVMQELRGNEWARRNTLVGVSGSSHDGTSGLRTEENSFDATRVTIEADANIVFTSNEKARKFWLGQGTLSPIEVATKYGGLKPCLHGSDAHSAEKIGIPDNDQFCWIKGDVNFESLKQACIEPNERVVVGPERPTGGFASQTITSIRVTNAPWMVPQEIPLNSGLVAVIGARGSGKTALADFIAVGASSMGAHLNKRSFVYRARDFLAAYSAKLEWESGEHSEGGLTSFQEEERWEFPRVQYLSQQFVEDLCSSEGLTDRLLDEIKRVIYTSHDEFSREGANNFDDLYEITCREILGTRGRHEEELARITDLTIEQLNLKHAIPEQKKKIDDVDKQLEKDKKDREALAPKGQEARLARHQAIQDSLLKRKLSLEAEQAKLRALEGLQSDITDFRNRVAPTFLSKLKAERAAAALTDQEWLQLKPQISLDADTLIQTRIGAVKALIAQILGAPVADVPQDRLAIDLIPLEADLSSQPVRLLEIEQKRLANLIGVDKTNAQKYSQLTARIQQAERNLKALREHLVKCEAADEQSSKLRQDRRTAYRSVFQTFVELEAALFHLYSPLRTALASEDGTLGKLEFVVHRKVNLAQWVQSGERLLDARKDGAFKGLGSISDAAKGDLLNAWITGSPDNADKAIDSFIDKYKDDLTKHKLDSMPMTEWGQRIWQWLLGTDHIEVTYGLRYGGVDIDGLSPGTRGIVLLLLYLAIDKEDRRPLIVDQPEENLDPQSVYDELVVRFREARLRRQIIIVTHNANLVVNTDADQVIVATAGRHVPGQLPEIKYDSGGLENPYIRRKVCEILKGGEEAFRARAKRLRLNLG